jgi:hypothetical protein
MSDCDMDRTYSMNGVPRNAHKVLDEKPHGRRLLGRKRRIWENNIKMQKQVVKM